MRVPRDVARDIIPSPTISSIRRRELAVYLIPLAVTVAITDFYHPLLCHNPESESECGSGLHGASTTRPVTAFAYYSERRASSEVSTRRATTSSQHRRAVPVPMSSAAGVPVCPERLSPPSHHDFMAPEVEPFGDRLPPNPTANRVAPRRSRIERRHEAWAERPSAIAPLSDQFNPPCVRGPPHTHSGHPQSRGNLRWPPPSPCISRMISTGTDGLRPL